MLPKVMENFLLSLAGENKSEHTLKMYRINLRDFLEGVFGGVEPSIEEYNKLTTEDIMSWLEDIRETNNLSASTLNQKVATLRKFYTYLQGMRLVSTNVAQMVGVIKEDTLKQRAILTEEEAFRLLDTAREVAEEDMKFKSYRDELIVNIFLGTGIRIQELCNIDIDDINRNTGELTVIGKRGKKRVVFVQKEILILYDNYLKIRSLQKHQDDSALFLSRQKSKNGSYRLSTDQIRKAVVDLAKRAEVTSITPHSLRHTNATLLIKDGADIMDVSKHLGHSTTAITEKIYIHQTNESARRVSAQLGLFNNRRVN